MAPPKLSVSTPIAILAILYLVAVVGASTFRTTITTTTVPDDEGRVPCKSGESCEEQINDHEFTNCEKFILKDGAGDRLTCCRELWQLDRHQCRCEALQEIVKKGEGEGMGGENNVQEIKDRARNIIVYCRMGTPQACNLGRSLVIKKVV